MGVYVNELNLTFYELVYKLFQCYNYFIIWNYFRNGD